MNTDAKLRVRDSYANPHPQTAHSGPLTPPAADNRPPAPITSQQVSINEDVYMAHQAILTTVSDFLLMKDSPLEAISHVLRKWLATGPDLTPHTFDAKRLEILLALMDFLYKLLGDYRNWEYLETEAQKLEQLQGGASHD